MCSPMKTRPSVTIARYSPRKRVASGATMHSGQRGHQARGRQPDQMSVTPKPERAAVGSPLITAAVYAPMPRKNAWPSETWPA